MIAIFPSPDSIRSATRDTAGTLVTVPAGTVFICDIYLGVSMTVAGNTTAAVSVNGAGADPVDGSIAHRVSLDGLALSVAEQSGTIECIVRAPAENDVTLDLAITGAGNVTCTVNGIIL